jgi:hypothetical protein
VCASRGTHARTNSLRGLLVLNQVLIVVERKLHKVSDPGRLPSLDLLLAGFIAQLLRGDVTIPPNKVMYAAVWPLVLVLPWTETPCSPPSSLLSCLLPYASYRIASAAVLAAAALLRRWSRQASCAWSRRCAGIDPEDQRSLPLDIHPPTVLVEHWSWLRLLVVVDAFVPDNSFLECDLPLVPRFLLPTTTSSEEVLAILVALLQLP